MYVSVCASACPPAYLPNHTRDLLSIAVARSSFGGVTKSHGKGVILGIFFHIDNALYGSYSCLDFATKDRFGLSLLICRKVGQNSISNY